MRSPTKELPDLKLVWITVSDLQAAVFQKLDTLSTGYVFIQWITQFVSIILIHWIMIYLVYCAVQNLNNWGQNCNVNVADKRTAALILFNSKLVRHTWKISADIKATLCEKSQKTKSQEAAFEDALAAAIGPFMSLLLSSHPVLCMISETKKTVDHTTWEHFLFFFNNSDSWLCYSTVRKWWYQTSPKFVKILRISGGNIGKIRCIYCFIVCKISLRENCRCGYSFRRDENSAQNESWVLFIHFWWTIYERKHERNKAKGLMKMIII